MSAPYSATLAMLCAAALLSWAVKVLAIGQRPLVASVVCWLRDSHNERKQAIGGSRCQWCRYPLADLGSVSPLRKLYSRNQGGSIERSSW